MNKENMRLENLPKNENNKDGHKDSLNKERAVFVENTSTNKEDPEKKEQQIEKARKEIELSSEEHVDNLSWDYKNRGQITLPEIQANELNSILKQVEKDNRFAMPALVTGNETATEYDSKAANYSTQTSIVEMSDGEKAFVVHSYKSTSIHRWMDGMMKGLTGYPMKKANRSDWKNRFEDKSNIPTINNDNPNVVVLPFIPNVNLDDLFCNQKEIDNFGECDYAKTMNTEDLLGVLSKVTDKINDIHDRGYGWGEMILANVIIDDKQDVHICDPEVAYNEGVSVSKQKAYDLLDLITSSCTSLEDGHEFKDYSRVVASLLDGYKDKNVFNALKELAIKKLSLKEKMFFGYSQARLRLKSKNQFIDIKQSILDYIENTEE